MEEDKKVSKKPDNKIEKTQKETRTETQTETQVTKVASAFTTKIKDIMGEFRKIIWPDRKTLTKHTVNTVIVTAIIGAAIVGMDYLFSFGYSLFIRLGQ